MKKYIVEQKITALVNRYAAYEAAESGDKGNLIAFAQQKRLKFKEEIIFYADEERTTGSFRVKAEKVMDVHGKFIVTDTNGKRLGAVRKSFKASLLRSTWEVLGGNDEVQLIVKEESKAIAIIRRLWAFVPYIGDFPFFVKYHFIFTRPGSEDVMARYTKTTRFRDHYVLQIDDESLLKEFGWQTFIAQGVLLDALQSR